MAYVIRKRIPIGFIGRIETHINQAIDEIQSIFSTISKAINPITSMSFSSLIIRSGTDSQTLTNGQTNEMVFIDALNYGSSTASDIFTFIKTLYASYYNISFCMSYVCDTACTITAVVAVNDIPIPDLSFSQYADGVNYNVISFDGLYYLNENDKVTLLLSHDAVAPVNITPLTANLKIKSV